MAGCIIYYHPEWLKDLNINQVFAMRLIYFLCYFEPVKPIFFVLFWAGETTNSFSASVLKKLYYSNTTQYTLELQYVHQFYVTMRWMDCMLGLLESHNLV